MAGFSSFSQSLKQMLVGLRNNLVNTLCPLWAVFLSLADFPNLSLRQRILSSVLFPDYKGFPHCPQESAESPLLLELQFLFHQWNEKVWIGCVLFSQCFIPLPELYHKAVFLKNLINLSGNLEGSVDKSLQGYMSCPIYLTFLALWSLTGSHAASTNLLTLLVGFFCQSPPASTSSNRLFTSHLSW